MSIFQGKRYWLVGASEGMGRALSQALDKEGAEVILSARNADRLAELARNLNNAQVVPIDVTDADSVKRAATEAGRVDAVIYNAGAYDPMPTSEWNAGSALQMTDVNYGGALRVLGELIPEFLARGAGDITLIGSLSGYRGLPRAIGYGASKAAMISMAETMRMDLRGTGVTVRIVNPGFIRTRLTAKNNFRMPQIMEPEAAAGRVMHAMRSRRFRTDFPPPFSWLIRVLDYLPDWIIYRGK